MASSVELEPVVVADSDRAALDKIEQLIARDMPVLTGPDGETVELPEPVVRLLRAMVYHLAQGSALALVPVDQFLTTQQAAELLNVSRPYLIRLLDDGHIRYSKTGSHRRIRLVDLLAYKSQRDAHRRTSLSQLTQMSQEVGLYDE